MSHETAAGPTQAELWNGPAARAWIDRQEMLDRLLEPFVASLLEVVPRASRWNVLDVGCGTGATTLALARHTGAECVGVDISAPMLEVARNRAADAGVAARFACADAQRHDFGGSRFDAIVSRFGVMFFDDPPAAFANLLAATRAGGALRFLSWRSAAENPFMTTAERAAMQVLPELPPRPAAGPGQFALSDPRHIRAVLEHAGWCDIDVRPLDVACSFPESELHAYVTRLGPLGAILEQRDEAARARILDAVLPAFAPFIADGEVRFNAACWRVDARAGTEAGS